MKRQRAGYKRGVAKQTWTNEQTNKQRYRNNKFHQSHAAKNFLQFSSEKKLNTIDKIPVSF